MLFAVMILYSFCVRDVCSVWIGCGGDGNSSEQELFTGGKARAKDGASEIGRAHV